VCKQKQARIQKMREKKKWKKILKNCMHKKKVGNHMEDYLCVGFLLCHWLYKNWSWEYTNHALYFLLSRTCNRNIFENSNKERTNFLLQDKWNNFLKKTCGCKAHCYCKNVWRKSKFFVERKRKKITNKEKSNCV